MAWPRGCALIETLWSPKQDRDLDSFLLRLDRNLERFDAMGVNYRRLDHTSQ